MSVFRAQVWNLTNCKLRASLVGHTGYINTVTVSPDGSLCASGGKARPPRSTGRHVTAQAWQHDMECAVVALFAEAVWFWAALLIQADHVSVWVFSELLLCQVGSHRNMILACATVLYSLSPA